MAISPPPFQLQAPTIWSNWYNRFFGDSIGQTFVGGRVLLVPFYLPQKALISEISTRISTIGGAGTNLRLGLYKDNGLSPFGGALIQDAGLIAADVLGARTIILQGNISLARGYFWFAIETQDGTVALIRASANQFWSDHATENLVGCHFDRAGGFGVLPNICPAVSVNSTAQVRASVRVETWG